MRRGTVRYLLSFLRPACESLLSVLPSCVLRCRCPCVAVPSRHGKGGSLSGCPSFHRQRPSRIGTNPKSGSRVSPCSVSPKDRPRTHRRGPTYLSKGAHERSAAPLLSHEQRSAASERRQDEEEARVHLSNMRVSGPCDRASFRPGKVGCRRSGAHRMEDETQSVGATMQDRLNERVVGMSRRAGRCRSRMRVPKRVLAQRGRKNGGAVGTYPPEAEGGSRKCEETLLCILVFFLTSFVLIDARILTKTTSTITRAVP